MNFLKFLLSFFLLFCFSNNIVAINDTSDVKLVIDNILINNKPYNEYLSDSIVVNYKGNKAIVLDYKKHNDFTIIWVLEKNNEIMLDNKYRYAFRLLGYENEWVYYNGINNYTRYTKLKPGYYCFEIMYSENGKWFEDKKIKQYIYIKPKFWQTLGFKSIMISAKIVFLGFIIF